MVVVTRWQRLFSAIVLSALLLAVAGSWALGSDVQTGSSRAAPPGIVQLIAEAVAAAGYTQTGSQTVVGTAETVLTDPQNPPGIVKNVVVAIVGGGYSDVEAQGVLETLSSYLTDPDVIVPPGVLSGLVASAVDANASAGDLTAVLESYFADLGAGVPPGRAKQAAEELLEEADGAPPSSSRTSETGKPEKPEKQNPGKAKGKKK